MPGAPSSDHCSYIGITLAQDLTDLLAGHNHPPLGSPSCFKIGRVGDVLEQRRPVLRQAAW